MNVPNPPKEVFSELDRKLWPYAWYRRWESLLKHDRRSRRLMLIARGIDKPTGKLASPVPHHKINHDEPTNNIWND